MRKLFLTLLAIFTFQLFNDVLFAKTTNQESKSALPVLQNTIIVPTSSPGITLVVKTYIDLDMWDGDNFSYTIEIHGLTYGSPGSFLYDGNISVNRSSVTTSDVVIYIPLPSGHTTLTVPNGQYHS